MSGALKRTKYIFLWIMKHNNNYFKKSYIIRKQLQNFYIYRFLPSINHAYSKPLKEEERGKKRKQRVERVIDYIL